MKKMPALYLLDSILKTVGSPFTEIIQRYISDVFCSMFLEVSSCEMRRSVTVVVIVSLLPPLLLLLL